MFEKNRKQRLELFKQIKGATHNTRTARLSWNMQESQDAHESVVTASTAGFEAVKLVRDLMSQYVWPTAPKLSYTGMRHTSVRLDQEEVDSGVITVTGELRSPLGVKVSFDVPIEIRAGRLLEPSIMVFGGQPRVISQSTIDTVIRDNNTYMDTQPRSMYGAPFDKVEAKSRKPFHQERRSPGLFAVAGKTAALREFIRTRGMKGGEKIAQMAPLPAAVEPWEMAELQDKTRPYGPAKRQVGVTPRPFPFETPPPQTGPVPTEPTLHSTPKKMLPSSPQQATQGESGGMGACEICGNAVMPGKYAPSWCSPECFRKSQVIDTANRGNRMPAGDEPAPNVGPPHKGLPKGDEPPSRSAPSASRSKPSTSKPSTSKASKQAHMNAEEKKTVLFGTSKNPEPVASNPAMGEDIDDNQPNVEDDLERKQQFMPGSKVSLKKKLSAPTRGGGRVILDSGKKGVVIRDQAGDGYAVYVKFDDGQLALVPGKYL